MEIRQLIRLIYWLHIEGRWPNEAMVARLRQCRTFHTRLFWPVGRYYHSTRIHHHSVRYTILLALLPLVVWLLIPSRTTEAEIVEKRVKTETIRREDMKFEDRWFPIYNPPKLVKTIPIMQEIKSDDNSARPEVAGRDDEGQTTNVRSNSVRHTKPRTIRYAYRDICTRHNMRRVITNNGRSWRCRRV